MDQQNSSRRYTWIVLIACLVFLPLAFMASQAISPGDERWTVRTQIMGYFFLLVLTIGAIAAGVRLILTRNK